MAFENASIQGRPNKTAIPFPGEVRLLLIDDSPDDRALAVRELKRELPDAAIVEAADESSFEAAFAAGNFDVVITDFQLVWSNGLRVIERVKRRWPDVPVIMFTGSGTEEIAVQAMKAGVHDYVLKASRHFAKLRSSVHLALRLRQNIRALAQAEARYKTLFDTVPVGLFRCTPGGEILEVNPALAAILKISDRRQLRSLDFAQLHAGAGEFAAWREVVEREGSIASMECRFKLRNGEIRWVEIHAKALRDPVTRQIEYEGSVEDISARKEAEVEREKLIADLQQAIAKVKTLSGLLPICASCKKIRDEAGAWNMIETYIEQHSQAHFTHGFCPECARTLYPEVFLDRPKTQ